MATFQNNEEFVSKNSDFVMKLRLVGVGGTPQIRRVRLPRIVKNGGLSYEELVSLSIEYTFPDAPNNPDEYDVTLTYYDEDNDCVTVASTDELVDAIGQFSSSQPPVLRLTTDVKRKKNSIKRSKSPSPAGTPTRNSTAAAAAAPKPQVQIQAILESVVTALAAAAVTIHTHIKAERNSDASTPDASPASSVSSSASKVGKNDGTKSEKGEEQQDKKAAEQRPFIHGRHTCDGCLCTPIIGTRHHATNLPDYDLCTKCFGNYKGDEIKFEPAALDRDRPFQERWHRRRHRAVIGRGRTCPRRHHNHRRFAAGPNPVDMDSALKEAIRRSLQDSKKKEPIPPVPAEDTSPNVEAEDPPSAEETSPNVKAEDSPSAEETSSTAEAEDPPSAEEITSNVEAEESFEDVTTGLVKPDEEVASNSSEFEMVTEEEEMKNENKSKHDSYSKDAEGNGDVAEALGHTLDECARAIDDMMTELTRESKSDDASEDSEQSDGKQDDSSPEETAGEVSPMTSSVPSLIEMPQAEKEETEPEINVTKEDEEEQEPAPDAGATILESNENDANADENEAKDIKDAESRSSGSEDEWQVVNEDSEVAGDEMLARAFQLLGSALYESDMSRSGSAEEAATSTTVGDGSRISASGTCEVSITSSVPTSVPSISSGQHVPAAVLARWPAQLEQLRELGFDNEQECVEVLERLHAANVGVDSTDEVTVSQVVNEMLKK